MAFKAMFVLGIVFTSCVMFCSSQNCGFSVYPDAGECDREGVTCDPVTPHITGGVEARRHELPYQVSLIYEGNFFCGGILWDNQHVITATHCTKGEPADKFQLAVGQHKHSESDVENPERIIVNCSNIVEHEDYDSYWLTADIALLTMAEPIDLNNARLPICFDQQYAGDNTFGLWSTVSGWGSESDNGPTTDELRYATINVLDFEECRNCDGFLPDEVAPGMICAGFCGQDNDKNTCYGDSGGPLVVKEEGLMYAVGITSWGYGCDSQIPGVYTDIAYYEDWIEENLSLENKK